MFEPTLRSSDAATVTEFDLLTGDSLMATSDIAESLFSCALLDLETQVLD
jgi:hypothetical protein